MTLATCIKMSLYRRDLGVHVLQLHDLLCERAKRSVRGLRLDLGPSTAASLSAWPVPRPMVDGDGCGCGFKAIGQGTGRAEPLPRAAYRQGKLSDAWQMIRN